MSVPVGDITFKEPGNSLPKWIRAAAETRGYGDSKKPLSLFITEGDISEAFACASQGNGSACVMAQAGTRIGAKSVYFYRTTAWVDFGDGPIVRFQTSRQIYGNVIEPFDRGEREAIAPGIYHLTPPTNSRGLKARRKKNRTRTQTKRTGGTEQAGRKSVAHTERVVMAASA